MYQCGSSELRTVVTLARTSIQFCGASGCSSLYADWLLTKRGPGNAHCFRIYDDMLFLSSIFIHAFRSHISHAYYDDDMSKGGYQSQTVILACVTALTSTESCRR